MAHKKSRKRRMPTDQRNTYVITKKNSLLDLKKSNLLNDNRRLHDLKRDLSQSDKRIWHPKIFDRLIKIDGRPSHYRQIVKKVKKFGRIYEYTRIGFKEPKRVATCIKRKIRREVLFAFKKAGKGKSGPKRRKYNEASKIKC